MKFCTKVHFICTIFHLYLAFKICHGQKTIDTADEFPTYDLILNIMKAANSGVATGWAIVQNLSAEDRQNKNLIQTKVWPKILSIMQTINTPIKEMDLDIHFRRKPSTFLDTLLNVNSLEHIQALSQNPKSDPFGYIKLRWLELSSSSTQMMRFYDRRIRDILNGGRNMKDVANSIINYKASTWNSEDGTPGKHAVTKYAETSSLTFDRMFFENDGGDVFAGLKRLMDNKPGVLTQPQFDRSKACQPGQREMRIEPNGQDLPYYLLFHLCLVDIKSFVLQNFMHLYNDLLVTGTTTPETDLTNLVNQLKLRVQTKIDLFHQSFGIFLQDTGPAYNTLGGTILCDPPEHIFGDTYEKLTNFIKVFVAPEQELHKSRTCRPTCDLLDATYAPCGQGEIDCKYERERECVMDEGRCQVFDPVCKPGAYQCQNSSLRISACPSKRFDRLYEYIKGEDIGEEFHFGPKNYECKENLTVWQGGWRMEEDVLVNTPHFCEMCVCYCFETLGPLLGNVSTRFFSLKSERANFKENRIIVGIKFHRIKDQIHIATADALALPGRGVDMSTVKWNIPKYQEDPKFVQRLSMDLRSLNLDDVATKEPDRVLTGVRFYSETYMGNIRYQYIGLEILTHKIDVKGKIIPGTGIYRRNSNSTIHRTLYQYPEDPINEPDDPVNGPSSAKALPDSTTNMYIVFRGTSLVKDAAQSTIPYFDSQKLISLQPSWLKGIGIVHKVNKGYGGFLAFKLIEHTN